MKHKSQKSVSARTNQEGSVGLLLIVTLIALVCSAFMFFTSALQRETIAYSRASGVIGLKNIRNTVIDLIDCAKVVKLCSTTPDAAELISRSGGSVFSRTDDGYQTVGNWKVDVDCVPEGVLIQAHPENTAILRSLRPYADNGDVWLPVLRADEVLCQDCTANGLSAPFPVGFCRETI